MFCVLAERKFHEKWRCLTYGLTKKEKDEISNDLVVFLSLYTTNIGFLYLLDERSGVPRIRNVSSGPCTYPIIITNAYATVDKLFPLMQMGMTLLRGEVALRVLGEAICLGSETVSPRRSWISASQEIVSLLNERITRPDTHQSKENNEKCNMLRSSLIESTSAMSAKVQKSGLGFEDGSEWAVELSFLKTILEKFDGRTSYAGLKPIRSLGKNIIWTSQMEAGDEAGEVKPPGDYVDPRFRYDAFIHSYIHFHQEQGSEVSSMTTAYHEEASKASQTQPEDGGIPVVIQTLSAVCEEEPDERTMPREANSSRREMSAVPLAVSDQESTSAAEQIAEQAGTAAGDRVIRTDTAQEAATNNDEYSEVTASSDESSSSDATYTAVLETLGFSMYANAKEDDTIDKSSDSTGDEVLAAEASAEHNKTDSVAKYHLELERSGEEESRSALSLLKEEDVTVEGTFSDFCAHQVRDSIIEGIDTHRKIHAYNHNIRLVLTAIEEQPAATAVAGISSACGLAIHGEEEKQIEKERLCTADQLLSFVKHSVDKEREIKEKDAQIADLKNAIAAFDSMKTAEIHVKDLDIREVTRKLRLYPETSIRSGYDGDDGMPRLNNESEL